ncbi:MAG: RidA family protein [Betaproteobacteria bacterium]
MTENSRAEKTRAEKFAAIETGLGYSFDGEIKIGGNYVSVVRNGKDVYVSGQIPRVGSEIIATGPVGAGDIAALTRAQLGAKVSAMRALALLRQSLGTLDAVDRVLRIAVFVQSSADFTAQSEVADAASDVLHAVLGPAGVHTRTSVGVMQLPKNATVEIDLIATAVAA